MKPIKIIFAVAIVVRIAGIWIPQLWYDENFTLILARLPFDRMIAATAGDVHPPLWYLIEWMWIRLFPDPILAPAWTLRIPSLVFSLLALYAAHLVFFELEVPKKIHLGALALMAILPMQIWYAQEARMYALLELEVLLALLFALRGQWLALFITSTAMLYTQNYGVFYLACIGIVVFLRDVTHVSQAYRLFGVTPKWQAFTKTLYIGLAMLGASLLYMVSWFGVMQDQMHIINGRYWIQEQSIGDVLNILYKLFWGSSMPSFALLSALMITFMAISVGLLHMAHETHAAKPAIIIMAFGPLLIAWIVSTLWQPILLHRPLIGTAPFLYVIAAWSFGRLFEREQIKSWREASIAAALVVPVMVSGVGGYFKNIPDMKSDGAISPLTSALDYVRAHWQDGDVIYYTDDGPMINLSPYASELPQFMMSACGDRLNAGPVLGSLSPATRAAIGIPLAELNEINYRRAWVFAPRSPLHPVCYEEQIAPYTPGDPLIVVDDNIFIESGVWLVVEK